MEAEGAVHEPFIRATANRGPEAREKMCRNILELNDRPTQISTVAADVGVTGSRNARVGFVANHTQTMLLTGEQSHASR